MKKSRLVLLFLVALGMAAGCATKKDSTGLTKIRVEVFDRNDAPDGQGTTTDNKMTQWIQQEVAKIGLEVEFVACPREQENQKLNVWLASSNAPDIVFTYNNDYTFQNYAENNGLHELTPYLETEGKAIKEKMASLLEYGMYNDKLYAIPGKRTMQPSSNLKMRQDWLDKLGLEMPKTVDELYTVLKAFKENDPGNVGKDRVVPFAMAAPGTMGNYGSCLDLKYSFGVKNYGPFGGTYKDGVFKSMIDTPEGKEYFLFLNKLYKEGLIHQEFAVDTTGSRYTQHVATGVAGLVDTNGSYIDGLTEEAVPEVDWMVMEPLPDANGERVMSGYPEARWLNLIPKSSKVPAEAVRYINWMVESKADITLTNGFEGEHYKVEDGVIIPTLTDTNKKDFWKGADLDLIGYVNYMIPRNKLELVMSPEEARKTALAMEYTEKYAVVAPVLTQKMPVSQEKVATLTDYVNTGLAKLIVASDFEAEYANYVNGWYSLGGGELDKEYEQALNEKFNK